MTQELIYTSAPRGLRPGSQGFCTVVRTQGLPGALAERLEALSGYRPLYAPPDPRAALNPVAWSHLRVIAAGITWQVVSRIWANGLDHTQRTNKFAHHLALAPAELPAAGPAALLAASGAMDSAWDGTARVLPAGRRLPATQSVPRPCQAWQAATGDAGWAGVLAETALQRGRMAYLVFAAGMDPFPLIQEALALVPPTIRWGVTFSTYFTGLPPGVECQWRCVLQGSVEAQSITRGGATLLLDLTSNLGPPPSASVVAAARSGNLLPQNHVQPNAAPCGLERPDLEIAGGTDYGVSPEPELTCHADPSRPPPLPPPQLPKFKRKRRDSEPVENDSRHRALLVIGTIAATALLLGGGMFVVSQMGFNVSNVVAEAEVQPTTAHAMRQPSQPLGPSPPVPGHGMHRMPCELQHNRPSVPAGNPGQADELELQEGKPAPAIEASGSSDNGVAEQTSAQVDSEVADAAASDRNLLDSVDDSPLPTEAEGEASPCDPEVLAWKQLVSTIMTFTPHVEWTSRTSWDKDDHLSIPDDRSDDIVVTIVPAQHLCDGTFLATVDPAKRFEWKVEYKVEALNDQVEGSDSTHLGTLIFGKDRFVFVQDQDDKPVAEAVQQLLRLCVLHVSAGDEFKLAYFLGTEGGFIAEVAAGTPRATTKVTSALCKDILNGPWEIAIRGMRRALNDTKVKPQCELQLSGLRDTVETAVPAVTNNSGQVVTLQSPMEIQSKRAKNPGSARVPMRFEFECTRPDSMPNTFCHVRLWASAGSRPLEPGLTITQAVEKGLTAAQSASKEELENPNPQHEIHQAALAKHERDIAEFTDVLETIRAIQATPELRIGFRVFLQAGEHQITLFETPIVFDK